MTFGTKYGVITISTMKTRKYFTCVACLAVCGSASAFTTATFVTGSGATDAAGDPVNAQAVFTTSGDMLTITLTNLLVNQLSVGQNISDLFFTLNNVTTGGSLTASSGLERTVHPNGTFTNGSVVSTGWVFSVSGGVFHLDGLNTAAFVPSHTILGSPDGTTNLYSNSNDSINGEVGKPGHKKPNPHNPFLAGDVSFTLDIPGINTNTVVTSATFSFGTAPGDTSGGGGHCTSGCGESAPDGGSTSVLLGVAVTCLGVMRRYLRA